MPSSRVESLNPLLHCLLFSTELPKGEAIFQFSIYKYIEPKIFLLVEKNGVVVECFP